MHLLSKTLLTRLDLPLRLLVLLLTFGDFAVDIGLRRRGVFRGRDITRISREESPGREAKDEDCRITLCTKWNHCAAYSGWIGSSPASRIGRGYDRAGTPKRD